MFAIEIARPLGSFFKFDVDHMVGRRKGVMFSFNGFVACFLELYRPDSVWKRRNYCICRVGILAIWIAPFAIGDYGTARIASYAEIKD